MEKSGKQHCVRDVAENVAVEPVVATLKKKEIAKGQRQTELSVNASPLKTDGAYDGLKCILEYVENELHMSTKLSLVEYVEVLVKEEAWKVVKFSEDDRLNKVTGKSFCSPSLSLFPSFLFNFLWLNNVKSTCYHHCIKVLSATTLCLPFLVAAGDL